MAIPKASQNSQINSNTSRQAFIGDSEASLRCIVGVSDMKTSHDPRVSIVTHSLGSCVGVVVCDPVSSVGGILHFQLPSSNQDAEKAARHPFIFADTGIPLLIEKVCSEGACRNRLTVKLFGGANIMDRQGFFNIGRRNYIAARKILWKLGFLVTAEDVGGDSWRTIALQVGTGVVTVKNDVTEYAI